MDHSVEGWLIGEDHSDRLATQSAFAIAAPNNRFLTGGRSASGKSEE